MPKITNLGAPVEVIGASFKRTELDAAVGVEDKNDLVNQAEAIILTGITSEAVKRTAAALIIKLKTKMDFITAARKKIVKKLDEAKSEVEAPFKTAYNEVSEKKSKLDQLFIDYEDKLRKAEEKRIADQREAERIQREQAAQEKAQMAALGPEADLLAPDPEPTTDPTPAPAAPKLELFTPPAAQPAPAAPVNLKTAPIRIPGVGTVSTIKTMRVRILDPSKVPVTYMVPSERLLLDAYDEGTTEIPGVEFYPEYTTRTIGAKKKP